MTTKKLLIFDHAIPSDVFLAANIALCNTLPFNGCMYKALWTDSGTKALHDWVMNDSYAIGPTTLDVPKANMQSFFSTHYKYNFPRINMSVTSGVQWWDDATWAAKTIPNWAAAATFSKAVNDITGASPGLLIDPENYVVGNYLMDLSSQPDVGSHTTAAYQAKVKARGGEVITAIQAAYSNAVLFFTFLDPSIGPTQYDLLNYFMNGILDNAGPGIKVISGFENSYKYKNEFGNPSFSLGYTWQKVDHRDLYSDNHAAWDAHVLAGFGIWMDATPPAFDFATPSANYYTPTGLQSALTLAMQYTDEYVWMFDLNSDWTSNSSTVTQAYRDAVTEVFNQFTPPPTPPVPPAPGSCLIRR